MAKGNIRFTQKPVSVEGCNANWIAEYLTLTINHVKDKTEEPPFILYRLSYMYYTVLGAITAIGVGALVSYFTGCNKNKNISHDLYSPVIHHFLKPKKLSNEEVIFIKENKCSTKS